MTHLRTGILHKREVRTFWSTRRLCLCLLAFWGSALLGQSEDGLERLPAEILLPSADSVSWFAPGSFEKPKVAPLPIGASLNVSLPRRADISLSSLFVGELGLMDEVRQEGAFKLAGETALRYGYDRNLATSMSQPDSNTVRRQLLYHPFGPDFESLSAGMFDENGSWSTYYGGHLEAAPGLVADVGAYYTEVWLPGTVDAEERLQLRYALSYALGEHVRLQASGGQYSDYDIFAYEDDFNANQALIDGGQNLGLADLFRSSREEQRLLAVEVDLGKRSTLRLEGYEGGVEKGMNLWLRHRR